MKLTKERLEELKAANLPVVTFDEIMSVGKVPSTPEEEAELVEIKANVNKYLSNFVLNPEGSNKCICCGKKQMATDIMDSVLGTAYFEWGLAYGTGHCRKCGYPATLYHDIPDEMKFTFLLQDHPNNLSFNK